MPLNQVIQTETLEAKVKELEKALREADMDTVFTSGSFMTPEHQPLREIIRGLQETYCGTLAVEYMYLSSRVEKKYTIPHNFSFPRANASIPPGTNVVC